MPRKKFTPPRYEENVYILFDKKTGNVLATEQRWTLIRKKKIAGMPNLSEVLERIRKESGKRTEELDVLILTGQDVTNQSIQRVDVKERRPVFKEPITAGRAANPSRISSP